MYHLSALNLSILWVCVSVCSSYDDGSLEMGVADQSVDVISPQVQAAKLLDRLQNLDKRISRYFYYIFNPSAPLGYRNSLAAPGLGPDSTPLAGASQMFRDALASYPLEKRQSASGTQICIWKVCPPTPWRREGRGKAGK